MARGRLIAKSLSTSQRYAALVSVGGKLGEFCQALYPLLVAHADDFGRLAGDPFTVKHLVVPASPRSLSDVGKAIGHLHTVGLIQSYIVDDRNYIQIKDFEKHQGGLHKRTTSAYPEPPGNSGNFPLNRIELNGIEEISTAHAVDEDGFVNFWATYPRKVSKADAVKAWGQVKPVNGTAEAIAADVARRIASGEWGPDRVQFIPHASTYLRGRRWEDEPETLNRSAASPRALSAKQIEDAKGLYRRWGSCQHDPKHDNWRDCVEAIARAL